MGFDAGSAVTALQWDFTAFGAGSGVAPEPSDVMIERFKRQQLRMATAMLEQVKLTSSQLETDDQDIEIKKLVPFKEAVEAIRAVDGNDELSQHANRQMCEIIAQVLSDCPNADQIEKLPLRVRMSFFGWVNGQLLNPEMFAAGTKISR